MFLTPSRGRCPLETPIRGLPPPEPPQFLTSFEIIDPYPVPFPHGPRGRRGQTCGNNYRHIINPPPCICIVSKSTISCEKKPFYIRYVVHSMKFYYHVVKSTLPCHEKYITSSLASLVHGNAFFTPW